ncbi:MAG: tetratricopeptide repeat protein [Pirellulaceae bacterium]
MLAIGRYLLGEGEDARTVLNAFYDFALKNDSRFVEAHIAIAELALDKSDYVEAVKSLEAAVELRPEDPQIHYLLAKAWAPSDTDKATEQLMAALELNPRHTNSLLMQAENAMDSEAYDRAEAVLQQVIAVNPQEPRAWALRAAIAHLTGNYQAEGQHRSEALKHWDLNPQVDYMIGSSLSQHYRFAEGVKYQRRALKMNPNYQPARFQLAQDLLRVGQDDEGWSIVDQVAAGDKYNVMAFNLKTLQKRLAQFTTIEVPGFVVRMDAQEAAIYGPQVVELLQTAQAELRQKYDIQLTQPVTVEIFPQQSDFAIRTFGLPGGAGFLGVCFGNLITANSPASQGDTPSNWRSVLWHEFCHVITLNKTKNRMPRWLSEGISVYEELERDPSWGQSMTPTYKQMLLGEDFVPLSRLSEAFLHPKSGMHLQFAYFESSLAVRYLVDAHGLPLLLKLLDDLGMGVPIEEAFARRYGDTQALDDDFQRYVTAMAEDFLPDTTFERDGLPPFPQLETLQQLIADDPTNYFAQQMLVQRLLTSKQWSAAIVAAERLQELYPQDTDSGGALQSIAVAARELGNEQQEREALEQIVALSSDDLPALLRLLEIAQSAEDWELVWRLSQKVMAVQPLIAAGHESQVTAARRLDKPENSVDALRSLMEMQPLDPARLQYELAEALLADAQEGAARREVLKALELSPRYQDALALLLKIHEARDTRIDIIPAQPTTARLPDAGSPPAPASP